MLPLLFFAVFLAIPACFWLYGRRWLGSQTHPAALFILASFASSLALNLAGPIPHAALLTIVWVGLNFAILAVFKRIQKGKADKS